MTRWGWLGFMALTALAILSVLTPGGVGRQAPLRVTPVATAGRATAETGYRKALAPRFERAALDADALVEIGERRSRNLLEIRAAQNRMSNSLAAIDLLLANGPPPKGLQTSISGYREGAEAMREAMTEAQAGFVRLDWDRVAAAYERAETGAAALHRAERLLASAAAGASATPGPPTSGEGR